MHTTRIVNKNKMSQIEIVVKKIADLSLEEKQANKNFLIGVFGPGVSYQYHVYTNPKLELCILALIDKKIVGHIGITRREFIYKNIEYRVGGVGDVAVDESYRKLGIGKKLMTECSKVLASNNFNLGLLFCFPRNDEFYLSCGWTHKTTGKIFTVENNIQSDQGNSFYLPVSLDEAQMAVWSSEDLVIGQGAW